MMDTAKVTNEPETAPVTSKVEPSDQAEALEDLDDADNDNDEKAVEGADEEEALFVKMEEDEVTEEATLTHEQPTDVKAAPKLLQKALENHEVEPDDSEKVDTSKKEEEKKGEEEIKTGPSEPEHHYHARVSMIGIQIGDHSDTNTVSRVLKIYISGETTRFLTIQSIRIF